MGFLAGSGTASAILLDEVLKPRAATLLLASSTLEAPNMIAVCVVQFRGLVREEK